MLASTSVTASALTPSGMKAHLVLVTDISTPEYGGPSQSTYGYALVEPEWMPNVRQSYIL